MSLSKFQPAAPAVDGVWSSPGSIDISRSDVLSYAFGRLGEYDNDSPIFVDANDPFSNLSAKQTLQHVLLLIEGLKKLGLKEGDCVCLHAFNCIWYPVIWLAVIGSGARFVGSNPKYTKSEMVHLLNLAKPKVLIAQADCMEPITEAIAAAQYGIPSTNIFSLDNAKGAPLTSGHASWRTLLHPGSIDRAPPVTETSFDHESIAVYGMTSGTTGFPKAALISHRSIVAQAQLLETLFGGRPYRPSQLVCLPVYHAFASPLALVLPLRLGMVTYLLPKWSLPEYLRAVETFAITDTPVAPPIVGALIALPDSDRHRLKALRFVVSAGAALPAMAQNTLCHLLAPEAVVTQCWGTTEGGWQSVGDVGEKDHSGSVGRLLPNVQLKLVSDTGELIEEAGKSGEALIKSSTLFSGYLENPDATEAAFDADGFYRTGDQVTIQNGHLYYNDRIKDTMKVKGWQVSPTELESVLNQHPLIADSAVVGMTRLNNLGIPETHPTAYVVRRSDASKPALREQDVVDFVAARLITYKRITGGVVFIKEVPRSSSGKILRRSLQNTQRE